MHKHKFLKAILILTIVFSTLFSFSISNATTVVFEGETITREEIVDRLHDLQTRNPFEMFLSGFLLEIGDFVLENIVFLVKAEVTIDKLVFNKVPALNPNFFEMHKSEIAHPTTKIFCGVINTWYDLFQGLAIIVYLIILVYVGIKILLRYSKFKS